MSLGLLERQDCRDSLGSQVNQDSQDLEVNRVLQDNKVTLDLKDQMARGETLATQVLLVFRVQQGLQGTQDPLDLKGLREFKATLVLQAREVQQVHKGPLAQPGPSEPLEPTATQANKATLVHLVIQVPEVLLDRLDLRVFEEAMDNQALLDQLANEETVATKESLVRRVQVVHLVSQEILVWPGSRVPLAELGPQDFLEAPVQLVSLEPRALLEIPDFKDSLVTRETWDPAASQERRAAQDHQVHVGIPVDQDHLGKQGQLDQRVQVAHVEIRVSLVPQVSRAIQELQETQVPWVQWDPRVQGVTLVQMDNQDHVDCQVLRETLEPQDHLESEET